MMKQARKCGTTRRSLICGWLSLGAMGALDGLSAQPAAAQEQSPSKASCAQAYESAQESRASGQLQNTRQRLSFCARSECPSFVQKDCARWLEEVERELPSIVISVVGLDVASAAQTTVKVDGQLISGALTGAAIVLDPGRHELVIERPGQVPIMRAIVAQQGVQSRPINIDVDGTSDGSDGDGSQVDEAVMSSPLRPYAYAAWGVGAVGLGAFAVLGTLGRADQRGLKEDCPRVTDDENATGPGICFSRTANARESSYERAFILADVGLVTGILGVAAGTVLFILSSSGSSSSDGVDASAEATTGFRFDVSTTPGGGFATVEGTF